LLWNALHFAHANQSVDSPVKAGYMGPPFDTRSVFAA